MNSDEEITQKNKFQGIGEQWDFGPEMIDRADDIVIKQILSYTKSGSKKCVD